MLIKFRLNPIFRQYPVYAHIHQKSKQLVLTLQSLFLTCNQFVCYIKSDMLRLLITLFFIISFTFAAQFTQAQRFYEPGYVVLCSGDTLFGKIKDRRPAPFVEIYRQVRFRNGGIFPKKFSPREILQYRAGEREYESLWISRPFSLLDARMISIPGRGRQEFFRVLVRGPLSLYMQENFDIESGYYDDIPYLKREDKKEYVRATQGIFGLKRKLLAEYFDDCPAMQKALEEKEVRTVSEVLEIYQQHCTSDLYPDYEK